ncbi:hypothetical protein LTR53_009246 [Teratosphaeriaceae sp. CCFEE 6253]|nr:hypothetical protein LTR53_009246 [Teratosphaeriaceae sp. CCFEE 6253]
MESSGRTPESGATRHGYQALDHEGLQFADRAEVVAGEGIEVRTHAEGLEVVPGSNPFRERRSSLDQPEAWHVPNQPESPSKEVVSASVDPSGDDAGPVGRRRQKRYCGMRGLVLVIAVVAGVAVLIAVLLGSILGTVLPKKHASKPAALVASSAAASIAAIAGTTSSTAAPTAMPEATALKQSGLAITPLAASNDVFLTYYQASNNSIMEHQWTAGQWTASAHSTSTMVTMDAQPGSPLAAVSYELSGAIYRQLFFIALSPSSGLPSIYSVTAVDDAGWSSAEPLSAADGTSVANTEVVPDTPALAACWGNGALHGIRLYYGDSRGYIQEVGNDLGSQQWQSWNTFADSDPQTAVACDYRKTADGEHLIVYTRNTSTGALQQSRCFTGLWTGAITPLKNLGKCNVGELLMWATAGPSVSTNITIDSGSDIAAATDGVAAEYVLFQRSGSAVVTRGLVDPAGSDIQAVDDLQSAAGGGKLASAYYDGGVVTVFQNSSGSNVWVVATSGTGDVVGGFQTYGTA